MDNNQKFDAYQAVTDKFIELLSQGTVPWFRQAENAIGGAVSYESGKPYSLLNQLIIGKQGEFLTFNRAKELGGRLRAGSHGHKIWFWCWRKKTETDADGNEKEVSYPVLKFYHVFDVKDFDGLKPVKKTDKRQHGNNAPDAVKNYLERETGLRLEASADGSAYYSPAEDLACVPERNSFGEDSAYYAAVFHELTHSTMKESRCDRMKENDGRVNFGKGDFSREELVAELGSSLLLSACGMSSPNMSPRQMSEYATGWLYRLKADKKLIVTASSRAEKAVKYILCGKTGEEDLQEA